MNKEIWKPVFGYEDTYQVSNYGRVKRFEKVLTNSLQKVIRNNGSSPYFRLKVNLWKNNKYKTYKIHRLVAQAFIPNPENKPQVNHVDNNSLNNHVSNLEWCTNKENIHHAMKQGRMNRGINNGMSKLNEKEIKEIRSFCNPSYKEKILLSKKYCISYSYLNTILRKETWKHI